MRFSIAASSRGRPGLRRSLPSSLEAINLDAGVTIVAMTESALRPDLFGREPPPLIICESKTSVPDSFSKNPILLDKIINGPLLMLVQPACDAGNDDRERCENRESYHQKRAREFSMLSIRSSFRTIRGAG